MGTSSSNSKLKPRPLQSRDEYTIGIVCALENEAIAVQSAFDYFFLEEEEKVETAEGDGNTYSFGTMGRYHVVLAHMGDMGGLEAKDVANNMQRSFKNIKLCLVVGICGIIPKIRNQETLLGDVVISTLVKQYDRGKEYPTGFQETNMLGPASSELRRGFNFLATPQPMKHLRKLLQKYLMDLNNHEDMQELEFHYPGYRLDHLYNPEYVHEHSDRTCAICDAGTYCKPAVEASCDDLKCSPDQILSRQRIVELDRLSEEMQKESDSASKQALDDKFNEKILPKVYLGTVASGNKVMKNGKMRDDVAADQKVIAFEMEGAGVWSTFPTVVIKSGCDYGDSHKNKKFQKYASMVAAACAKAFLQELQMGLPKNVMYGPVGTGDSAQSPTPGQHGPSSSSSPPPASNSGQGGVSNTFSGTFKGTNFGIGNNYTSSGNMYIGSPPPQGASRQANPQQRSPRT